MDFAEFEVGLQDFFLLYFVCYLPKRGKFPDSVFDLQKHKKSSQPTTKRIYAPHQNAKCRV